MSRKIKLIWEFRGNDSKSFAEHHTNHLKEFAEKENLILKETECRELAEDYWIACLIVSEPEMIKVRDALRPQRAQLA